MRQWSPDHSVSSIGREPVGGLAAIRGRGGRGQARRSASPATTASNIAGVSVPVFVLSPEQW